jgi:catechol 2,3-dioxygenase
MIRLSKLGHVNLRVSDEEQATRFYCDVLGLQIAERDPQHGGVFTTLGGNFHTLDFAQHPDPQSAQKPVKGQLGLVHIAFQVDSYAALRDAYLHLLQNGVTVERATNHENQRSIYFRDPDGNGLEIYYEFPYALQVFPNGRSDEDHELEVGGVNDPTPAWLQEDWPDAQMQARIDAIRRQLEPASSGRVRGRSG